jgi:hypothetical protein
MNILSAKLRVEMSQRALRHVIEVRLCTLTFIFLYGSYYYLKS